jgi:hypothetical protein
LAPRPARSHLLGFAGTRHTGRQALPDLTRDGVRLVREEQPTALLSFFSMRDPVLGGNSREKIALRRAIQMAIDDKEWIRVFDAGFSTVRQQVVPPGVEGHITGYVNPNNFDAVAANALLERFGFRKAADGYRRNPDGTALAVSVLTGTSSDARKSAEFTKRMLDRIGIRITVESVTPAERLKRMTHCRFGMASMDWGLDIPDGTNPMSMFYSKSIGSVNMSCYEDAVFDAAFEKALVMAPGPNDRNCSGPCSPGWTPTRRPVHARSAIPCCSSGTGRRSFRNHQRLAADRDPFGRRECPAGKIPLTHFPSTRKRDQMSMSSRKRWTVVMLLVCAVLSPAQAADPAKVLRLALPDITGLDPHQITDLYSARIVNVIFEGLYQYDYLASPAKVIPNTAAADARDHRRRQDVDHSAAERNPVHRRSRVQGCTARTVGGGLRLFDQAIRSTPTCASAAIPRSRRC